MCNLSSIKIQLLLILKKGLLTELEREKSNSERQYNFWVWPVLVGREEHGKPTFS